MLSRGCESTLLVGINSTEVLLVLIIPNKRLSVDRGDCVLSPLPTVEAWHRQMPMTAQVPAVRED